MSREVGRDEVDEDLATAVGLCVIADVTVPEAAKTVGVTRWELEETIRAAGMGERLGLEDDASAAAEIDAVFEGDQ